MAKYWIALVNFDRLSGLFSGVVFHSDAKILPLAHYDLIIGMDWLV